MNVYRRFAARVLLLGLATFACRADTPALPQQTAVLDLSKESSVSQVLPGSNFFYVLTLQNVGFVTATNVVLTDTLPASVTFQSATTTLGTFTNSGSTVTINATSLVSEATLVATILVQAASSGMITNRATATAGSNVAASASATTLILSDLRVTCTDSADPASLGQSFTYLVAISNAGSVALTNVVATNMLPSHVDWTGLVISVGTVVTSGHTAVWTVGPLAAGGTASMTLQVRASAGGTRTNYTIAIGQSATTNLVGLDEESTAVRGSATDLSGDGLGDLVMQNAEAAQFYLQHMSSTNGAGSDTLFGGADIAPWLFAATADVDGDGTADLIMRREDSSVHAVVFVQQGVIISSKFLFGQKADIAPWIAVAGGDFDGDGSGDVVFQYGDDHLYAMVLLRTNTLQSAGFLFGGKTIGGWRVVGGADSDGDGLSELVLRDGSSGIYGLAFVNGLTLVATRYLTGQPKDVSPWRFRAASDLDGDAFDEFVFQRGDEDRYEAAIMDGFLILRSSPLFTGQAGLSPWHIIGPR